jgi:hypothetical protein
MTVRHTGRRHDAKGRTTSIPADQKLRKMLGPPEGQAWIWLTWEMITCSAFRELSRAALLCFFRLMAEHMAHAGRQNGLLAVTYSDFKLYGVRESSIPAALRELELAGFVLMTVQGGRSYGCAKRPSRFRLTWLPTAEGIAPTNDWKRSEKKIPALENGCALPPKAGAGEQSGT